MGHGDLGCLGDGEVDGRQGGWGKRSDWHRGGGKRGVVAWIGGNLVGSIWESWGWGRWVN